MGVAKPPPPPPPPLAPRDDLPAAETPPVGVAGLEKTSLPAQLPISVSVIFLHVNLSTRYESIFFTDFYQSLQLLSLALPPV